VAVGQLYTEGHGVFPSDEGKGLLAIARLDAAPRTVRAVIQRVMRHELAVRWPL